MHIASEYNNRNKSGVKMAYQLKVRCYLCLWNAEYKIVVESCLPELRTAFSMEESDVLIRSEAEVHTDTQHTHTHTHTLPTLTNHHTTQVLNTMSQQYDGIQCRLTARTAESAKDEILDWEFGNKQTDRVKTKKRKKGGHKNKLQTATDTGHTACRMLADLEVSVEERKM
jgi:hypothetical protein